jgi:hypothetical protein
MELTLPDVHLMVGVLVDDGEDAGLAEVDRIERGGVAPGVRGGGGRALVGGNILGTGGGTTTVTATCRAGEEAGRGSRAIVVQAHVGADLEGSAPHEGDSCTREKDRQHQYTGPQVLNKTVAKNTTGKYNRQSVCTSSQISDMDFWALRRSKQASCRYSKSLQ